MTSRDKQSTVAHRDEVDDDVDEADLQLVLKDVPKGALALVGVSLLIVVVLWLVIYFGVFIPRGPVN